MSEKNDKDVDEDAIIAAAQEKLLERRREYEREQAKTGTAGPQTFKAPPRLGPVVPSTRRRPFSDQLVPSTKAALAVGLPGLLYLVPPPDRSDAAIEARIRGILPDGFVGRRSVTWGNIASVLSNEGRPSLGAVCPDDAHLNAVCPDDTHRLRGAEAARFIWQRTIDAEKVVLLGETGSGKSIVAAAMCEQAIRQGHMNVRWTHAKSLKEPGVIQRAVAARFLVLDDLGYELNNAKAASGWIPTLAGPASDLLAELYAVSGRRLITTTYLEYLPMAELYGGGAARRVYEGAEVIRLFRVHA